jgi:ring-1,2-phenylacetyl-CoA epoxidase subunit PaaB
MTSSEWPVYQVFERPAPQRPLRAAGSVHAVDAEMALQNAWAVYGRRPTAVGLWVVPRELVLMKSKEELAGCSPRVGNGSACDQTYCVFRRFAEKIVYEQAASVLAANAEQAMARALEQLGDEDCQACWVFPLAAVTSSESSSRDCSFAPQQHKWFRDHKSFPVGALLRDARAHAEDDHDA